MRCLLLLTLVPHLALAWGFDGHRRLASMMHEPLPATHCLRGWLERNQTPALQDRSCDPDRERVTDSTEAPRHYLEIDWLNPPSSYPRDWQQAQLDLRQNALRNGTVPWRVEEQYQALVAAFRGNNSAAILDRIFYMSHYVTDAFSVLHNTRNFDPNDGLHSRWESDMLNVSANINAIRDQARTYFGTPGRIDPRYATFDIVLAGQRVVPQLIAADVAAGGLDAGAGYQRTVLFTESRELTARRWGDALTVMSSLIWLAWAEAGAPSLTGFANGCSRAPPTVAVVLRGFPPPNGWTALPTPRPDSGVVDASVPDAGRDAGTASTSDGGDPLPFPTLDAGVDVEPEPPMGCQCQGGSGLGLMAALMLALRSRR